MTGSDRAGLTTVDRRQRSPVGALAVVGVVSIVAVDAVHAQRDDAHRRVLLPGDLWRRSDHHRVPAHVDRGAGLVDTPGAREPGARRRARRGDRGHGVHHQGHGVSDPGRRRSISASMRRGSPSLSGSRCCCCRDCAQTCRVRRCSPSLVQTELRTMPPHRRLLEPLRDRIEAAVAEYRDQECLVLPDATLTYGEVDRLANATANVLLDRGVREGSVVMTLCDNGAAQVATWFACMKIGAVFAPLNASLSGDPLAHVMAGQAGACSCATPRSRGRALALAADSRSAHHVWSRAADSVWVRELRRAVATAGTAAPPPPPSVEPAAPARLMFTSGTTGESKGVLWSRNAETLHAVGYGDELVRTASRRDRVHVPAALSRHRTGHAARHDAARRTHGRRPALRAAALLGANARRRCRVLPVRRARSSARSCRARRAATTRTTRCVARWGARRRRASGSASSAVSA